ncbi:FkbM family methyltransferase [Nostoc sp. CMAA1605]|uniref:FkbM family methyltransferase n=1 Tax=Nostoc sp. CMAA1605 TaxID=2055159 RepID=UPI001F17AC27|nr:FkbM family methyltransferase [Nostoc sp. CMAA1605]MCF4967329.1 FkbM family methyltransferase [Nostoc sp. CMAA1605]
MKIIKNWLKNKLRNGLKIAILEDAVNQLSNKFTSSIPALENSVNQLNDAVARDVQGLFGVSYWYEGNLWEPTVQIALRDLCKPGDVVFDVGANFGGLTSVMSRMVGPKGVVCAFEASPRIIDKCQRNLVLNGCNNVQIYNVAVYSKSNEKVPIYLGGHLNDSIYSSNDTDVAAFNVSTVALDDFIHFTGLVPNLIKMDIEGAEFDAIQGMSHTLVNIKPHLILETQPQDTKCLSFLREKGYVAIDLNNYHEVKSSNDYPDGVAIRNNLYIHQDRLSETLYKPPFIFHEISSFSQEDFTSSDNLISLKSPINLDKGRYLIDIDFSAKGIDNEMMCGVKMGDTVIFRYHAYTSFLAQSYRDWIVNLTESSEINLYFEFLNGTFDDTFLINQAKIFRIAEFDNSSSCLYT